MYIDGILSRFITNNLPLVTDLELSGAKGGFQLNDMKPFSRFAILAAGSGITPMFAIIGYLLERKSNKV